MEYEAVIGLEVHAELETLSKMFCSCARLDSTVAQPNRAVCPVRAGMPGVLPVVNRRAVEYALRVALALECEVAHTSLFVRKNYFYPDLPKGYQISQYEQPLARNGRLAILTSQGERLIFLGHDTGAKQGYNPGGMESSSYPHPYKGNNQFKSMTTETGHDIVGAGEGCLGRRGRWHPTPLRSSTTLLLLCCIPQIASR